MTPADTYDARETARAQELHGSPLAPFPRRAGAFIPDYFINPNRRTVHDRIAETIVVLDRPRKHRKEHRQ